VAFGYNWGAIMMNTALYGSHFNDQLREDFYPAGVTEKPLWVIKQNGNDYKIVNINE
jgi:hypothetical protein